MSALAQIHAPNYSNICDFEVEASRHSSGCGKPVLKNMQVGFREKAAQTHSSQHMNRNIF